MPKLNALEELQMALDLVAREANAEARKVLVFTPRECPACKAAYDSAIRPNVDALQQAYEGLLQIAGITLVDVEEMGRKGGKSRAANMTPAQRSDAARAAANARWAGKAKKKAGGKKGK